MNSELIGVPILVYTEMCSTQQFSIKLFSSY